MAYRYPRRHLEYFSWQTVEVFACIGAHGNRERMMLRDAKMEREHEISRE